MKDCSIFYQSPTKAIFFLLFFFSQYSYAGTTFTKISITGTELADNATEWSCVRHNTTGQIWEVKTLLNKDDTYNYTALNHIDSMNNQIFCGLNNWRMPTIKELNSITDKTKYDPSVDTVYFPNTISDMHWSASVTDDSPLFYWITDFNYGDIRTRNRSYTHHIRLVSGDQYFDFFDYTKLDSSGNDLPNNASDWACVRDNKNGLIWEVKTPSNRDIYYPFDDALTYAAQSNSQALCGFNDWRIPDIEELITAVDYTTSSPSIKTDFFPRTNSYYFWSNSSSDVYRLNSNWAVYFDTGQSVIGFVKDDKVFHVRLVRTVPSISFLNSILFLLL